MKLHNPKATIDKRTLAFLEEVYHEIVRKKDLEVRMGFTAAKHFLTPGPVINAARALGLVDRAGWNWHWTGKRPSMKVALQVREEAKAFYSMNSGRPRAYLTRKRNSLRRP